MANTNASLWRYDGNNTGIRFNPDGSVSYGQPVPTAASYAAGQDDLHAQQARERAAHNRLVNLGRMASIIIPTAGMGLSAAGVGAGASAAAPGAAGTAATVAPKVGTIARLGSIFSSPGFEVGVNGALTGIGMIAQNRANSQARRDTIAQQTKAIELEQQRLALEAKNADLDREDARKLNDAIQALEEKKFQLAQESAQYERSVMDEERAVSADYRNRIAIPAQRRMASILGLG